MPRTARIITFITAALMLRPSAADAQLETFVQAVRELTAAAQTVESSAAADVRTAAIRMETALVDWDRRITALEARVAREIRGAPDERAFQLHVELGVTYRVRGRLLDALREFDAAITRRPAASDVQVLRALTLEAAGRPDEAGQTFQAAWKLDAQNPLKAYYVARRLGTGNTAERARAHEILTDYYRRLQIDATPPATMPFVMLEAIPDNLSRVPIVADWTTFEGFTLLSAGRYSEAITALRQAGSAAIKKSEDSPLAHLARGRREEAQNHVAEARRDYQAALAGALVGRRVLLVGMARLALVEGDGAAAIKALSQAVQLSPNDPNIRKEFASAHAAEGDHDAAFCELMAALLIDRRDVQAHSAIGQVYLDTGRNAEAVNAFTRALDLRPDNYEVRYALATAHTRLGNAAEAARQLDIYDRFRQDALEQRRRTIASEVAEEKSAPDGVGGR